MEEDPIQKPTDEHSESGIDSSDLAGGSPNSGESKSLVLTIFCLILAFLPSVFGLGLINSPAGGSALLVLGATCCLISGFGISRHMENPVARTLCGLLLAGLFFFLNVIIVVLIGCSGMGRIAP